MGKSCVRFRSLEDLPLDVIAEIVERITPEKYIAAYQRSRETAAKEKKARAK
jgi:hypothetical protein